MEGHAELPVAEGPRWRRGGGAVARGGERVVLPHELRDGGAADSLPEPPLAPHLAHRLPPPHGGVALPLLPPRRAPRPAQPPRGRPPRARRHGRPHGGAAAAHRRHRQHPRGRGGRRGGGGGARRVPEDGGSVLGGRGRSCGGGLGWCCLILCFLYNFFC